MPSVLENIQAGNFRPTSDLLLAVLAIFIPPFPVLVKRGLGLDLLLNVLLLLLGGFPGIIHAWYIIVKYKDDGIPVVTDYFHAQRQAGNGHFDYQQIPENTDTFDQGGNLENGQGAHSQPEQSYPSQSQAPQEHGQQQEVHPPAASGSSNMPPPYDPSTGPRLTGDNKIQYGSQF